MEGCGLQFGGAERGQRDFGGESLLTGRSQHGAREKAPPFPVRLRLDKVEQGLFVTSLVFCLASDLISLS